MTGINYDDLKSYLYVSEDYGKNWNSIAAGLPDEPVNVILEDPSNENILYTGTLRGVFISIDRGKNWSYLGNNMPGAAIADLEIHEPSGDLIAGTHGRGIFKINLNPIHAFVNQKFSSDKDYLFETKEKQLPWFQSASNYPDFRTFEKKDIVFWIKEAKPVILSILNKDNKKIWTINLQGKKGFNQYRWDMIVSRQTSDLPYFTQYEKHLKAGAYKLTLSDGKLELSQPFIAIKNESPYKK
jgi:hypothetical protein